MWKGPFVLNILCTVRNSGQQCVPKAWQLGVSHVLLLHSIVGPYHTWSPSFDITHSHLQALWCFSEHTGIIQVLSPASVSYEAAVGNTCKATCSITQSKPSTLPTARAIRLLHRLIHGVAGSFLLMFVCNHTTCKGGDYCWPANLNVLEVIRLHPAISWHHWVTAWDSASILPSLHPFV